jgi:hypothetical protein
MNETTHKLAKKSPLQFTRQVVPQWCLLIYTDYVFCRVFSWDEATHLSVSEHLVLGMLEQGLKTQACFGLYKEQTPMPVS